jgi:hypothetical protein
MLGVRSLVRKARQIAAFRHTIPLDRCYHYRGFRYGGFGNNPYEDYILGLARGASVETLRHEFANAILTCRPRTFGEFLQLRISEQPPWLFPWTPSHHVVPPPIVEPAQNPDIVCHSCEQGVLVSHINREFNWLERAYASIRAQGYLPDAHGYITCIELAGADESSYLVLDGNHRISALHASGMREVQIKQLIGSRVLRSEASRWSQVRNGTYSLSDALQVFDRYFARVNPALAPLHPTRLIVDEVPLWAGV